MLGTSQILKIFSKIRVLREAENTYCSFPARKPPWRPPRTAYELPASFLNKKLGIGSLNEPSLSVFFEFSICVGLGGILLKISKKREKGITFKKKLSKNIKFSRGWIILESVEEVPCKKILKSSKIIKTHQIYYGISHRKIEDFGKHFFCGGPRRPISK